MTESKQELNYFQKLMKLEGKVEKKLNLNYIRWADAWAKLKEAHPFATFKVYENENNMPYFVDDCIGGFVKVSVTVPGDTIVTHKCHLPIMDHANNPMKKEAYQIKRYNKTIEVAAIDSFSINKNIQRALTKAIALHGVGLYVYQREDFPEDSKQTETDNPQTDTTSSGVPTGDSHSAPEKKDGELHMVCIGCGKNLTEKVHKYSMDKQGMSLCFMCQKKKEKGEDYLPKKEEEIKEEVVM